MSRPISEILRHLGVVHYGQLLDPLIRHNNCNERVSNFDPNFPEVRKITIYLPVGKVELYFPMILMFFQRIVIFFLVKRGKIDNPREKD